MGRGTPTKPKRVTVEFIPRERNDRGSFPEPYEIMDRLIATERADLAEATIGIAWRSGWKRDKDGLLKIGQCKKRNDLDRSLDAYDFVILLNREAWGTFDARQKQRLIFHELCHAQIEEDADGLPKRDQKGRLVTRGRKHTIQEFREVVERFGWMEDLSDLAVRGIADADRGLLKLAEARQKNQLPDDTILADKPAADEEEAATEGTEAREGASVNPVPEDEEDEVVTLTFKAKGTKNAAAWLMLQRQSGQWVCGWEVQLGNRHAAPGGEIAPKSHPERKLALLGAASEIVDWLDGIEPAGTADQKRAEARRIGMFREQFDAWMDEQIAAA